MAKINVHKLLKTPPFNADRQVKSRLARSMWEDSNDFLWRTGILLADPPHTTKSYLGKVYVDILMSIETSLKSLVISLSKKTEIPEGAYNAARKYGHKIDGLYNEVKGRASRRIRLLNKQDTKIFDKAITLAVSNRYEIITFLVLIQEDFIDRQFEKGQISSILNLNFINKIDTVAHKLKDIAQKSIKSNCDEQAMRGNNMDKYQQRLTSFHTTLKNQKKL